jgi:hypothetical protein
MTIIFIGTLNIPSMNTFMHNALRIQRISEAKILLTHKTVLHILPS